ncbi:ATP synthase F1 subcomplex delta subunit [Herbihabitans rhizosphaerae]|uniref:ATP synthase subunit delta n=1 Tax=Herbihabitans rhizosphaerae TaxID=1872711 RepID=A0A4V2ERM0_9PSEU|nr:F0F1 ATP synthase subunit delta [Herbihabitans rhizosphaerae]RZS32419.1 ATP synthase F1 subcomplex delta subunit [Herbihabitans rhizosphaerae]
MSADKALTSMHAASREALAACELELLDVLDRAGKETDKIGQLGDELFAVVGLLQREIGLRRTLADSSTDPNGRADLAKTVLAGKVGEPTVQVVATVVAARWSSPREMVDGLESLGVTTLLVRAEREGKLDTVEDELFRLGRIIADSTGLEQVLSDQTQRALGKAELLGGLIDGKTHAVSAALVRNLVTQPRGRGVVNGLESLAAAAAKRRERSVAHVISAGPLNEEQQERLSATLQRIYARPIALHVEVNPGLRGGLLIKVGEEVIDGSAIGQLEAVRRRLAS